ncbi:MAG: FkbM family methyltransferase [Candidatus Nanopusillus acidilobi]
MASLSLYVKEAIALRDVIEERWFLSLIDYARRKETIRVKLKGLGYVNLSWKEYRVLAYEFANLKKCKDRFDYFDIVNYVKRGDSKNENYIYKAIHLIAILRQLCFNGLNLTINNDVLSFNFNGLNLKFGLNCSAWSLNDVYAIGEYSYPEILSDLKEKDVVDIGANVGDSSIYFAVLGAKKVIGVEPLPNIANCAINNVNLNNLENKIKIINAGLSINNGFISVPCDYDIVKAGGFSLVKSNGNCKVPTITLKDVIEMVDSPYLLKLDCEGCEADILTKSDPNELKKFKYIVFETHPFITNVSDDKILTSLKNIGFSCYIKIVYDPKLGVNIYSCEQK